MSKITLQGNPINTIGELPIVGSKAIDFKLTGNDLSDKSLKDFAGKKIVLNIFPSIDTPVCANSVRRFNQEVSSLENTVVLCISRDLPFAQARFCGAEGLDNVITLSSMKANDFGKDYGVSVIDGPMESLLARAVVILDEAGKVIYTQLVPEIVDEPNYDEVLKNI
ncbi:MAG: thiol peroxidase [Candidatus Zophobacter franzmannii]|jgi:thiol peroxidase|nr:thiol peroxidase [Candidatus Zophobacter franzmannii]